MKRSVVVVSTSDESAPLRLRAAHLATSIAENFRESGKKVLFLMDSVTRYAMAQREVGLAIGAASQSWIYAIGLSKLPKLLERSGNSERGSITAFYTVLVEGDDLNEPISDSVRGILDGHIVLSRRLATSNHFPAINVLDSVSRLVSDVASEEEIELSAISRDYLSLYRKNEDMINLGAYASGANGKVDAAIQVHERVMGFLRQKHTERVPVSEAYAQLKEMIG